MNEIEAVSQQHYRMRDARHSYTDEQVASMRRMLVSGATRPEVEQRFHASREYVRQIACNRLRPGIGPDASAVVVTRQKRRDVVRALREAGTSIDGIVAVTGLKKNTVYDYCKGIHLPYNRSRLSPERQQEMLRLWRDGLSQAAIGHRFGVHPITAHRIINRLIRSGAQPSLHAVI